MATHAVDESSFLFAEHHSACLIIGGGFTDMDRSTTVSRHYTIISAHPCKSFMTVHLVQGDRRRRVFSVRIPTDVDFTPLFVGTVRDRPRDPSSPRKRSMLASARGRPQCWVGRGRSPPGDHGGEVAGPRSPLESTLRNPGRPTPRHPSKLTGNRLSGPRLRGRPRLRRSSTGLPRRAERPVRFGGGAGTVLRDRRCGGISRCWNRPHN